MTVQNSTAVRNAQGDAWETAIGTSAKVQIWSGSIPANCAAASTGTKLAEYSLASDWTAAAALLRVARRNLRGRVRSGVKWCVFVTV